MTKIISPRVRVAALVATAIARSVYAAALASPLFHQRKKKPRKGKGSYSRKGRTR